MRAQTAAPAASPPAIATFFRGAWTCIANDGRAAQVTYANAGDALKATFVRAGAGTVSPDMRTEIRQAGAKLVLTVYAPELRYAATSNGYDGNRLVFSGRYYPEAAEPTPTQVAITYALADENRYVRTIEIGVDPDALTLQHTEHCERQRIQAR